MKGNSFCFKLYSISKPLNAFVDAQTAFTKQIVKSFVDVSKHITDEATSAVQKAAKAV
jgi:hypothetical protein